MYNITNETGILFETSWEVCNKVGGIYTVLSTKARELKKSFGDRLIFIGPDIWTNDNPSPYFLERKSLLKNAAAKLKLPNGISIRVGRWNIPGSPIVVLVQFNSLLGNINEYFGQMWDDFKVDSLHSYGDYAESCAFAIAAALTIEALVPHLKVNPSSVIAHFDEWTTGMGLLHIKKHLPQAATIFTTHATSIGRSICGNGKPLYDYFSGYNGDQMAQELNMEAKHSLEKTTAQQADCFTTVSKVTADECRQLLDISPAVITPNGFEPNFIPGESQYADNRIRGRKKILKIASLLSGRNWENSTLIVATSGRNEYRNKGIDLFLDAVDRLRKHSIQKDILAIVMVPAWVKEPSGDLLVDMLENGNIKPYPYSTTHRLYNEDSDSIFCRLTQMSQQTGNNRVFVFTVPCYLDGHDGIVNIGYYDLLPALDLTVFPSYYEPWGYTPLESIAFGVPTVSSDKAGFGQWILSEFAPNVASGAEVLKRTDSNYSATVDKLAEIIQHHAELPIEKANALRNIASDTARKADWEFFIEKYYEAFNVAYAARDKRLKKAQIK